MPLYDDANSDLPAVNFWKDRKLSLRISRSCQRPVTGRKVPTNRRTPEKAKNVNQRLSLQKQFKKKTIIKKYVHELFSIRIYFINKEKNVAN